MTVHRNPPAKTRIRYMDSAPDVTTTGIGKNYDGYRIFYSVREDRPGLFEYIYNDGDVRCASRGEIALFKRDLAAAAGTDAKIADYLGENPMLKLLDGQAAPLLKGESGACLVEAIRPQGRAGAAGENAQDKGQKQVGER